MVLVIVFVGVLTILGAAMFAVHNARQDVERRNADALPLVTVMSVFGFVLLVIALQLAVEPGKDLKTVLTTAVVGSGVITANFGLWLNHRRYRVEGERQQVERSKADLEQRRHRLEQEKIELEHTKERREHDKAADELVIRVVELFGHSDGRVRGGALRALAALADQRPDRAPDVVNLVCMYLRTTPADDSVAREAQKVLLQIVRHTVVPAGNLDVDLTGAQLTSFVFENVAVRSLTLTNARLFGVTSLRGLGIDGDTVPTSLPHCVLDMDGAVFDGDVWLQGARVQRLSARGAQFLGKASFAAMWVLLDAMLSDSFVKGDADFAGMEVGKLSCSSATFGGQANFRGVIAPRGVTFLQTRFHRVVLEKVESQHVVFDEAHVEDALRLAPEGGFRSVFPRRMTVSAKVAGDPLLRLPSGWRIDTEDGIRYLVADVAS